MNPSNILSSIKALICFVVLFISHNLHSQAFQYFESKLALNKNAAGIFINQYFASNSVTSAFVADFVNGKFITDEQKNNSIANFKDHEIIAGEQIKLGFNFQTKITDKDFLYFEAGEALFYETQLHEDIFILLFKGNKTFENRTAILNPFRINSLQYFYLKAGWHRYSEKLSFKFNLGYAGAQRLLDLETYGGSLFTATNGRFIDLNLNLKSHDAFPAKQSFFATTGSGILSDLQFSYQFNTKSAFQLGLEGFGLIKWNKELTQRIVDTTYHFEGAEISNVLDSFSISVKNAEELKSTFIKEQAINSYQSNLPHIAYASYSQFFNDQFQLQLRVGLIKSEIAKAFFNSSINYYLSPDKLIGLNIDAGAYGNWNVGAQFAANFSNCSVFHIYFNSISNLFNPQGAFTFTTGASYRRAF